jgi:hypothetical protein
MDDAIRDALAMDAAMRKKFEGRSLSLKQRRIIYGRQLYSFLRKHVNLREVFGGSPVLGILKIMAGRRSGKKTKELLREHTRLHGLLRLIVLPFEEKECVEAARLVDCPAAFAYEHPETKEIRFMPVCSWSIYKNGILRSTSENYGVDNGTGTMGLELVDGSAEKAK